MKYAFSWVRAAWIISLAIMTAAAIFTFLKGENNLSDIAPFLGLALLITGFINIVIYLRRSKRIHGSHWLLADGLSTALLSVFLLFNVHIESAIIPFFFGVWELFSGVLKSIDSLELKGEKIKDWYRFTVVGVIEIISGVAALLKPIDNFVGMHKMVAIILAIQSCGYLFKILIYPHIIDRHLIKK